jgi:hypothetical protein
MIPNAGVGINSEYLLDRRVIPNYGNEPIEMTAERQTVPQTPLEPFGTDSIPGRNLSAPIRFRDGTFSVRDSSA